MILLALSTSDVAVLRAQVKDAKLLAVIDRQTRDPLTGAGAGPRTVLLRDEGDQLPFLAVSYDDPLEADRAWQNAQAGSVPVEWP